MEKIASHAYEKPGWKLYVSLPILSWALYDFANTIFSSNVNTIFFPALCFGNGGKKRELEPNRQYIYFVCKCVSLFLFSDIFTFIRHMD